MVWFWVVMGRNSNQRRPALRAYSEAKRFTLKKMYNKGQIQVVLKEGLQIRPKFGVGRFSKIRHCS
jgi:hypothetical protein